MNEPVFPLAPLPLEQHLLQQLQQKQIHTLADLLQLGVLEVAVKLQIGPPEAQQLMEYVSQAAMQANVTNLYHLHMARMGKPTHLTTLIPKLDDALRGGVPCGRITELVGPAGVGKTQLCFMLAVAAVAGGGQSNGARGGTVLYLDVERKFSASRAYQLAAAHYPHLQHDAAAIHSMMSNISVMHPTSSAEVLNTLQQLQPTLEQQQQQQQGTASERVCLILFDSIAAAVRSEFDGDHMWARQQRLGEIAGLLKRYAEGWHVPVVVTNQITTAFGDAPTHATPNPTNHPTADLQDDTTTNPSADAHITASLGTAWAHAVHSRLVLEYTNTTRSIHVVKAPDCALTTFEYVVNARGVEVVRQAAVPTILGGGSGGGGSVLGMSIGNTGQYGGGGRVGQGVG